MHASVRPNEASKPTGGRVHYPGKRTRGAAETLFVLGLAVALIYVAVVYAKSRYKLAYARRITPIIVQQEVASYIQTATYELISARVKDLAAPALAEAQRRMEVQVVREAGKVGVKVAAKKGGRALLQKGIQRSFEVLAQEAGEAITREFAREASTRFARELGEQGFQAVVKRVPSDTLERIAQQAAGRVAGRLSIRVLSRVAGFVTVVFMTWDAYRTWAELRSLDAELRQIEADIRLEVRRVLEQGGTRQLIEASYGDAITTLVRNQAAWKAFLAGLEERLKVTPVPERGRANAPSKR